jgi:hypothetical protein
LTSPLVNRLLENIEASSTKERRYALLAELACYKARVGDFEEAENLRIELRREFGDGRNLRISVLIMCAESLLLYFKDLSIDARDRMARANLLSNAAHDKGLIALTSSWLAHIDFNLNRYSTMADEMRSCFQAIESDDGTARCRVSIVLGDAFLFSGNTTASKDWYEHARRVATDIGDQAAIGAITYNRAALRMAAARIARTRGAIDDHVVRMVHTEIQTAVNYQLVAQLKSLDHLLQTAMTGVLILQDKFAEAIASIVPLLSSGEVREKSSQWLILNADLILALAQVGAVDEARQRLELVPEATVIGQSADDRVLIFDSISRAARLCGDIDRATVWSDQVQRAIGEHTSRVEEIRRWISPFESGFGLP